MAAVSPYVENQGGLVWSQGFSSAGFIYSFDLRDYRRLPGKFSNDHFRGDDQWDGGGLAMDYRSGADAIQP